MEKTIKQLIEKLPDAKVDGDINTSILSIAHDSRKVAPGALFVCIPGATVDGHEYIAQAVQNGAVAALVEKEVDFPGITIVRTADVRRAVRILAPYFYAYPARGMRMIGITGTNGKTTTSYLIRAILREAGFKVGLIGTIQTMMEDEAQPIHNTTPDVVDLQALLDEMRRRGMAYVVMEVSSHALAENRIAGCEFDTAVFTNATRDHLDFHKTFANYIAAKAKLFDSIGGADQAKSPKTAVANADDEAGQTMLVHAGCGSITYGVKGGADLAAKDIQVLAKGARFTASGSFGEMPLELKITGVFNVYNALAAIGAALAENISPEIIKRALEKFTSVPGRFELVDEGQNFTVIVDYAHTPDGLENVLKTARQITKRKLITVFGCGGDRDRTKRPIMGEIAARLSDIVIVTSDNPRGEDPELILSEVETGVAAAIGGKTHERIADRRAAIFRAIELAGQGDLVLIAGKGHEDYQILKGKTIHFDDRETARDAIRGRAAHG